MTLDQAYMIINDFGVALEKTKGTALTISSLKHSQNEIKLAFKVILATHIESEDAYTEYFFNNIVPAVSFLPKFIEDEKAIEINERQSKWKTNKKLDFSPVSDFLISTSDLSIEIINEFDKFYNECNSIKKDDSLYYSKLNLLLGFDYF